jgi:hypothetical protein
MLKRLLFAVLTLGCLAGAAAIAASATPAMAADFEPPSPC